MAGKVNELALFELFNNIGNGCGLVLNASKRRGRPDTL